MCLLWRHFEKVIYMEMGTAINENRDHNGEASVSSFHRSGGAWKKSFERNIYRFIISRYQVGNMAWDLLGQMMNIKNLKSGQNNKLFVKGWYLWETVIYSAEQFSLLAASLKVCRRKLPEEPAARHSISSSYQFQITICLDWIILQHSFKLCNLTKIIYERFIISEA